MLAVLSYNILFGRELEAIAQWLRSHKTKFDILCFQEFPKERINFLLKALQPVNYSFKYGTNFIHKGRDYGELTLINTKKLKFLDSKVIFLGTNIIEDKVFGLKGERSALITKLAFANETFILSNTHLIAYALNYHRRNQLEIVAGQIKSMAKNSNTPVILLGDLNYSSLIRQDRIFALMQKKGFRSGHRQKTHKLLSLKDHQVDYVFYKNCIVNEVEILKLPFSDHLPVVFKVQI